jgi:hypothetical protein
MSPRLRSLGVFVLVAALAVGCGRPIGDVPVPTPADFPTLVSDFASSGIAVSEVTSGDAGCADPDLIRTAIGFTAHGLDQAVPVRVHLYIFGDRGAWERLAGSIAACAHGYVLDPATYESVGPSPYVLAGQGPWGSAFRTALRDVLTRAAGNGG